MNSLIHLGAGPVRVLLSPERAELFQLETMNNRRAFANPDEPTTGGQSGAPVELVSVEARSGVHSGISAADRATTVAVLGGISPSPRDLVSPGHVVPRRGARGGLLERADAYQGALEVVMRTAEQPPGAPTPLGAGNEQDAVIAAVELLAEDGAIASAQQAKAIAQQHGLELHSLTDLVRSKLVTSPLVRRVAESSLPLAGFAPFRAVLFEDTISHREHLALVRGTPSGDLDEPVVRIHRRDLFVDVFGLSYGAAAQAGLPMHAGRVMRGLERIGHAAHGVFIYLDVGLGAVKGWEAGRETGTKQNGGQNAAETAKAAPAASAALQSNFEPLRDYAIGAQILVNLGVRHARIITDSPQVLTGSTIFGVSITGQESLRGAAPL